MNTAENKGLSMSGLKIIACISMLIDHITFSFSSILLRPDSALTPLYYIGRFLGRPAFIIFSFCVTEALFRTRNKGKYLIRIGILALISEIPFDLFTKPYFSRMVFSSSFHEAYKASGYSFEMIRAQLEGCLTTQNILFMYVVAFASIWAIEYLKDKYFGKLNYAYYFCSVLIMAASTVLVIFLRPDYGVTGLYCVYVLYLTRGNRKYTVIGMIAWSIFAAFEKLDIEWFGLIALIPILGMYKGEKGKMPKWFFYVFFPTHILILAIVQYVLFLR